MYLQILKILWLASLPSPDDAVFQRDELRGWKNLASSFAKARIFLGQQQKASVQAYGYNHEQTPLDLLRSKRYEIVSLVVYSRAGSLPAGRQGPVALFTARKMFDVEVTGTADVDGLAATDKDVVKDSPCRHDAS